MKLWTLIGAIGLCLLTEALAKKGPAREETAPYVPGELIVKLKNAEDKTTFTTLEDVGVKIDRKIQLSYETLYVVKFGAEKSISSLQSLLQSNPNIEYAEPNFIYSTGNPLEESKPFKSVEALIESTDAPDDPLFSSLWGLLNTGSNEPSRSIPGVQGADIDALKAWGETRGDNKIVIAVIDTGVDYNHPDLRAQMWVNLAEKNGTAGVDDDGNGYVDDIHGYDFANNDGDPMDGHGHGTHCAGTIGAVHNNGEGVAGVMGNVSMVGVKFLTDSGTGSTEAAIKSIDYASTLNVDIMSNSWGGGGYSQALKDAIDRAKNKGILFVAAAGNSGSNNDNTPHYPSSYKIDNVISVAATTAQDDLASFSCYGRNSVHIGAPGHRITSTFKNGQYKTYSGTSMATPHVSGALGLLLSQEGRMDLLAVRERLMATAETPGTLRSKVISGSGRMNAYNLLTDTRPVRNIPNPNGWETKIVDTFESKHPYGNNAKVEKTYRFPGAKFVRVKVKKYDLEKGYDFLVVVDKTGKEVEKISQSGENYYSEYVEGDTITLRFKSDTSVTKWGFIVEEAQMQ